MGSYEDGYASAGPKNRRMNISTEDKKRFLLKDIEDAKKSIELFEKSIKESEDGINAANGIIKIATDWVKEYDEHP